jgi:apoptosis-inducing factor 2
VQHAAQRSSVVVIGGGYGGINVARALDEHAYVTLVEPKDAFVHNIAALRALVEPTWLPRIFLPYDHLLEHGTVLRDSASHVDAEQVVLDSGRGLRPDFIVLATGSSYPFPAKSDALRTVDAMGRYRATHANLTQASRVMLLGAGAVGLELAGEIAAAWPDKHIGLVDQADQILPGPYDQRLRDELSRQLDDLGVQRVMGNALANLPETSPGEARTFRVATTAGTRIEADIWFRCYGVAPRPATSATSWRRHAPGTGTSGSLLSSRSPVSSGCTPSATLLTSMSTRPLWPVARPRSSPPTSRRGSLGLTTAPRTPPVLP